MVQTEFLPVSSLHEAIGTRRPPRWLVGAVCLGLMVALTGCRKTRGQAVGPSGAFRIAFGSCVHQLNPQPIWEKILAVEPNLFIFVGDNIYADTVDPAKFKSDYARLGARADFQQLRAQCPILATWDDHDYGENDAGAEFPAKVISEACFLDFFEIPADAPPRQRPGVYDVHYFGKEGQRIQVILLDTRYFRDALEAKEDYDRAVGPYFGTSDTSKTLLGEAQWSWLEEQLNQPAQIRVVVSSIQVVSDLHGWEKWMNFPHERERLFQLIEDTGAQGVVFISGDRHHGELSCLADGTPYPIYDVTSSGLNQRRGRTPEPNPHRIGEVCWPNNFGLIDVTWGENPELTLRLIDVEGNEFVSHTTALSELQP